MDRFLVELINRLNEIPNTQYCIKGDIIYVHRYGNGGWDKWRAWQLTTECMFKYNEYQKDPSIAVADLTGLAPMLRICAEVYLKVAG